MSYRYYKGFRQQKWPSNSLKVIGNHAIRWPIYDESLSPNLGLSESLSENLRSSIRWVQITNVTSLFGLSSVLVGNLDLAKDSAKD